MLGPPRNRACRAVNAAGYTVQRYSIPVLYSSYHRYSYHLPFISFQIQVSYSLTIFTVCRPAVGSAGLLSAPASSARHTLLPAVTLCLLSYCLHCLPSIILADSIRHPFGARLFRLRRARFAYLAILYHYRHFHLVVDS